MSISSSSRLTVYHDGQFWVGLFEQQDRHVYAVSRIVFGAEPSDEEIMLLVNVGWKHLRFSTTAPDKIKPPASNPKRRQREAAKQLSSPATSTKAQAALSAQREAQKQESKANSRERRKSAEKARFALKQEKRKQKHRGH